MSTITAVAAYLLLILNLLAILTVVFFLRRDASTRFAWLLVLVFMPFIGFCLYLIFGHKYLRRERLEFSEEAVKELRYYVSEQLHELNTMHFHTDTRYARLMYMNLVSDHAVITDDNTVEIFTNGSDKYARLIEDIKGAQKYIHMLYFIFRADTIGCEIIELLAEKASQGVEVRLVYDDLGNIAIDNKNFNKIKKAGGSVYRYSPVIRAIWSVNYRNHRKLVSIDGKVGYIGGMNIGDEYAKGRKKLVPWRDTHIRMEGSSVAAIELLFLEDFTYAAHKKESLPNMRQYFPLDKHLNGSSTIQIVSSMPKEGGDHLRTAFLKVIGAAEEYLYIQTPYLIPDRPIFDTISIAAASGVDVRIMIPETPDKTLVYYATLAFARDLMSRGVKIFVHKGFLHSKMIVSDDQVLSIGSANLDIRSFSLSFEANAFIFDPDLVKGQKGQFEDDMKLCIEADSDYFKNMSSFRKALMPVCQLFSPLL